MTKFNYKDDNGQIQEITIPDCIGLTLIIGLFGGLGGLIFGFIVGLIVDLVSLFTGWYN